MNEKQNEKLYWIALSGIFGPADPGLWKLMAVCEGPSDAYRRIAEGRYALSAGEKRMFSVWNAEKIKSLLKECSQKKIRIITFGDAEYPSKLRNIYNPPAVLYAYGNTGCLNDELTLGVVGTRKPSDYGYDAAFRISEELAKVGFTTVSGFAAGIDSAAHRGTLAGGGRTVAVLGCGLDIDYPKVNSDIREAVAENGVILSEFPPGTQPLARNFPSRNRIISGLSLGVFVAEAPLASGALITADSAIEQGRDVFCLPPQDIFSRSFQGVVKYLRDGAVPVFSHLDIIYEYCMVFSHRLTVPDSSDEYISPRSESFIYSCDEAVTPVSCSGKSEKTNSPQKASLPPGLEGVQEKIAQLLLDGPLHLDELCEKAELHVSDIITEMTDMEISGAVVSLPGNIYSLG